MECLRSFSKLLCLLFVVLGLGLASAHAQSALTCRDGRWTPQPVQSAQAGDYNQPVFHAIYGMSCNGMVYMIRMSNAVNDNGKTAIVTNVLSKAPLDGCQDGGVWTPQPIQKFETPSPTNVAFHTVYGLSCDGHVYMIRFSNVIVGGPRIAVSVLGQTPLS
jgi:hypothetical protein